MIFRRDGSVSKTVDSQANNRTVFRLEIPKKEMCLVHSQSINPLIGSETHETKV